MPRTKRVTPGGMVFHALNRGVDRMEIFSGTPAAGGLMKRGLAPQHVVSSLQCSYYRLGCLSPFHQARQRVGYGHLYQGRYRSFPVESDEHFYQVMRYVERNALRANLMERADDWRWSSLWRRVQKGGG